MGHKSREKGSWNEGGVCLPRALEGTEGGSGPRFSKLLYHWTDHTPRSWDFPFRAHQEMLRPRDHSQRYPIFRPEDSMFGSEKAVLSDLSEVLKGIPGHTL